MLRRPNYSKKSVKLQVEKLHRKCRYCKTHQDSRGFDRHEAWCKTKWRIRKELQELRTHPPTRSPTTTVPHLHATHISSPSLAAYEFEVNSDFVEGSSSMPLPTSTQHLLPEVLQNQPTGMTSGDNGELSQIEIYICILIGILQSLYSGLTCLENILRLFPIPTLQIQTSR